MVFKKKPKLRRVEKPNRTDNQKLKIAWIRLLSRILIIIGIITILLIWVGEIVICHDNNMYPSVKDGDLAITYKIGEFYQNDVVVYEVNGHKQFGKVVAREGDVIDIFEDGGYSVNGSMLYETIAYPTKRADNSKIEFPYTVKEDEYFILNDYREDMNDSRVYGGISNLHGKVVLLFRRRGFNT